MATQAELDRAWWSTARNCGVTQRFRHASLDSFRPDGEGAERAKEFAQNFYEQSLLHPGYSAIFVGKAGTGKTHLATAICRAFYEEGENFTMTTVFDIASRIKATWDSGATETTIRVLGDMQADDLLVIDEVGVQTGSDFERNLLFSIIDKRYGARKSTLLISNLDVAAVVEFIGERAIDRLREDGGKAIIFDWTSHRKEQKHGNDEG